MMFTGMINTMIACHGITDAFLFEPQEIAMVYISVFFLLCLTSDNYIKLAFFAWH